jgi:hypothetical protein
MGGFCLKDRDLSVGLPSGCFLTRPSFHHAPPSSSIDHSGGREWEFQVSRLRFQVEDPKRET